MQDGFIEFSDIKLQRAEETRLNVKLYLNEMHKRMMNAKSLDVLVQREDFLLDAVGVFYAIGLLNLETKEILIERINKEFMSRCDQLRERVENKDESSK